MRACSVAKLCPTLVTMDCSPPGSSIHGTSQAKIPEQVAIFFSRRSFRPRDWTHVSWIGRQILYHLRHQWNLEGDYTINSVQSLSHVWLFVTPMDCSVPGLPVHHQLLEFTQTHVHWVGDAIQLSHPLSSPSASAFNLSQHQVLFQWVSSSRQVAKVLEFQLQHQSFQWIFRTDFL